MLHFVILTPYLTRVLAREEYGIYNELYFWTALVLVLLTFRMETTFFRFGTPAEDRLTAFNTGSLLVWALTLFFAAVVISNAGTVATWLQYPDYPIFVVWIGLIIALDALAAMPFARLRLESRPIRFAAIRITGIVCNILCIFFFLEIRPSWSGIVLNGYQQLSYLFLANVLASGLVLLLLFPAYFRIRFRLEPGWLSKMTSYAFPLVLAGLAGITNQLVGTPMLKGLGGGSLTENLEQAGLYSAAAKLAVFMNLFTQAFNYAAEPFFFRQSKEENARALYARVAEAFAMFGSMAFLAILLYLDVIQYFLGVNFREGLDILPILLLANLFLGLYYNFSIWFKLEDRTRFGGYIALIGSGIVLALNMLLIPQIGYFGPAWASLACYGFMALAGYWTGVKNYPIPYPIGRMLFYIGFALLIYLAASRLDLVLSITGAWLLVFHTIWILIFLGTILFMERRDILRWWKGRKV